MFSPTTAVTRRLPRGPTDRNQLYTARLYSRFDRFYRFAFAASEIARLEINRRVNPYKLACCTSNGFSIAFNSWYYIYIYMFVNVNAVYQNNTSKVTVTGRRWSRRFSGFPFFRPPIAVGVNTTWWHCVENSRSRVLVYELHCTRPINGKSNQTRNKTRRTDRFAETESTRSRFSASYTVCTTM